MPEIPLPPVPWFQDPAEFAELLALFRSIQPMRVLEIGTFYGGTLWQWIDNLQPGAMVAYIDLIVLETDPRYQDVLRAQSLWPGWADERGIKLKLIRTNSTWQRTVKAAAAYAPYDFIFVDGGHEYKTVTADFRNYYPMLRAGGLMAFHDIAEEREPGVMRFWSELKIKREWNGVHEILRAPAGTWGIGVIFK